MIWLLQSFPKAADEAGRLLSRQHVNAAGDLLQGLSYTYNAAGIRTGVAEVPGSVVTFTYDGSYQLLTAVREVNPASPRWFDTTAGGWSAMAGDGWSVMPVDGLPGGTFTVDTTRFDANCLIAY